MPIKNVKMEESKKHHHFLSLRRIKHGWKCNYFIYNSENTDEQGWFSENCSSTWDIPPPPGWAPALIPPCPSPPTLARSEHDGDEDYDDDGDDSDDSDAGTAGGDKEVTI